MSRWLIGSMSHAFPTECADFPTGDLLESLQGDSEATFRVAINVNPEFNGDGSGPSVPVDGKPKDEH